MPALTDLLVIALATWRISHMVAVEDGPWDVLGRLRRFLGVLPGPVGRPPSCAGGNDLGSVLGCLISCPLCLSVWVAPLVFALWYSVPWAYLVVDVLAISGASSLLELVVNRR